MSRSTLMFRIAAPLACAAALCLFGATAAAQAPPLLPVQGTLYDGVSAPLEGTYSVEFTLYADAAGETPIWSELRDVAFTRGLFNEYLGDGAALNLVLFRDYSSVYLGMSVDGDDEMNLVRIATAPFAAYAQYCGDTALLDGQDVADIVAASVDALGANNRTNPYNHDRYTDAEAVAAATGVFAPISHRHAWSEINTGIGVSSEYSLNNDGTAGSRTLNMRSTTASACFLTSVEIEETDSANEAARCRVYVSGSNWVLDAYVESNSDARARCIARCLTW